MVAAVVALAALPLMPLLLPLGKLPGWGVREESSTIPNDELRLYLVGRLCIGEMGLWRHWSTYACRSPAKIVDLCKPHRPTYPELRASLADLLNDACFYVAVQSN